MEIGWIDLGTRRDARGAITFMEPGNPIPFPIKLVYYLHGVPPGTGRGDHAHRQLHEVLIAVHGGLTVHLDDGRGQMTFLADRPDRGLLIPAGTWIELRDFQPGTVCLLLASRPYEEADNIRERAAFQAFLKERPHGS